MEIKELIDKLESERPQKWKEFPDFMIYKDQLIAFMEKQHIGLSESETITSAMINNYTKSGLLPRAEGKKYGKEHIAYLTMTCLLKQILQVDEVSVLMKNYINDDVEETYGTYLEMLDKEFKEAVESIDIDSDEKRYDLAMRLAVSSYTQKLICQKLIEDMDK
ncbi:MAG: DUF1836 domain-containing protein [Peptostreptococcaceae bacterium]|nr:DUF1836 domain-containing protein [Peptostreptococcaceae bacterium]